MGSKLKTDTHKKDFTIFYFSSAGDLATQERWMSEIAEDFGQGKILGWYRGPRPVIYATDPAFLKEVFIKESETFIDRPMLDRTDNIPHLIMLKGDHRISQKENSSIFFPVLGARWKSVRSTLTPTFSAAKMKKTVIFNFADGITALSGNSSYKPAQCGWMPHVLRSLASLT